MRGVLLTEAGLPYSSDAIAPIYDSGQSVAVLYAPFDKKIIYSVADNGVIDSVDMNTGENSHIQC